jgi:predicted DNA-binding protein with PD1-like motif
MRYQRFGDRYIVRLESGEPVIETLRALLRAEMIGFANLSAAGAVRAFELGYWNAETGAYERRRFEEQTEVVSFQGNSALKGGEPFLHLHAVFSRRDFSVVGGHVEEAWVHPTLEVWLRTEDVPVGRVADEASGLTLLDLPETLPPAT